MGLLDKVKKVATDAAEAAKKGTEKAKDKVETHQIRKKMDGLAEQLGYLVYRERQGGAPAGADGDRLVSEMAEFERMLEQVSQPEDGGGSPGESPPEA